VTFQPRSAGQISAWFALAAGALALQGCSQPKPPLVSTARVYAADMQGGAKSCTTPKPELEAGKAVDAGIRVANDGGWCGVSVAKAGKPYEAGLLSIRPEHGKVFIHTVGDATRIDYTPDRGFTGSDAFTVRLLPGNEVLHVTAAVVAP
jgi:hypothetical protein